MDDRRRAPQGARTLPYQEGDQFLVPVERGSVEIGWIRGLVARMDWRGTVLGYFFPPLLADAAAVLLEVPRPEDAFLVARFSHSGLTRGEWPVLGASVGFDRTSWPVPPFGELNPAAPGRGWQVYFSADASDERSRRDVPATEVQGMPEAGLLTAAAVRRRLRDRISILG